MTTRWPIAAAVAPAPAKRDSRISTESPAAVSASAQAAPTIPAPTTRTSGAGMSSGDGGRGGGGRQPGPEGIARVEVESRPARGEGPALDAGPEPAVAFLEPAGEKASGDGLLPVLPARRELPPRVEGGHLRRGAGPAGRAVVSPARAEHVIAAVGVGPGRGPIKNDVVHDLATVPRDPVRR